MSKSTSMGWIVVALGVAGCSASTQMEVSTADDAAEQPVAASAMVEDPPDVHIEGDHLTIDTKIHFAHDSDEILGDSTELLDHIAQALKNHKELAKVHIIGHTDSSGDAEHNQELSERRAKAVVKALEERGVEQELDAKGVGESAHRCEEDTDECHEMNRRVEFLIEKAEE